MESDGSEICALDYGEVVFSEEETEEGAEDRRKRGGDHAW